MKKQLFVTLLILILIPYSAICQQSNVTLVFKNLSPEITWIGTSVYRPLSIKEFETQKFEVNNGACTIRIYQPSDGLISINCNLMITPFDVFSAPGDSIEGHIEVQGHKLIPIFTGRNGSHYNFSTLMKADSSLRYPIPVNKKYEGNMTLFFSDLDACYLKNLTVLNDYCRANNTTASFKKYMQDELHYYYLYYLLGQKRKTSSVTELQVLKIKSFSDSIFNRDDLIKSRMYTAVLVAKYLNKGLDGSLPPNQSIVTHFKEINQTELKGLTKEYLLTWMIKFYTKRGFTSDFTAIDSITRALNKTFQNKDFLAMVNGFFVDYKQSFKPLSNTVLNEKLANLSGKSIRLEDLLNQFKGKTIYIDFWASWCGPCKMDILSKEAVEMRKLGKSKGVVFLNISLDKTKDQQKWVSTTKSLPLDPKFQYRLVNDFSSPLAQYFNITSIPHYVLILKDGRSRIEDAPRITETKKLGPYFVW